MIVVTGISSFVGFHLALGLKKKGFEVTGIVSKPLEEYSGTRKTRLDHIKDHCALRVLDMTNETEMRRFISEQKPQVWIHHAGFAVQYASPDYDRKMGHAVNVEPLYPLFEALHQNGALGVIVTGSSMEYSVSSEGNSETDFCSPNTPYGLSKLAETLTAMQLSSKYNLPLRIARLYIPFGTFDAEEKLVSQVVNRLKNRTPVSLVPQNVQRDFLYIEDVVSAYATLVEDLKKGGAEIYNVCNGRPISIGELAEFFSKALQAPADLLQFGVYSVRAGEGLASWGRNEKLKALGWSPKPLEEGIRNFLK
ncbi:MAG: NAD(P)-dependent oxidoreductase [Deltaproteobacteria bacterium]|nr:NAD(P)-dependent oxidoreductase [Deltaproteobacteria bacterium]